MTTPAASSETYVPTLTAIADYGSIAVVVTAQASATSSSGNVSNAVGTSTGAVASRTSAAGSAAASSTSSSGVSAVGVTVSSLVFGVMAYLAFLL